MPQKRNKCIALSCFRRASTVVFNPQHNQHAKGSAIQIKRKDRCLLQQLSFKKEGQKACLDNSNGRGDWQLSLSSRRVLNIICCWDMSSAREAQHLGKPKLTAAGTGCVQVTLTLISQPKPAPCHSPRFLVRFKKICLLEAQHEASTWQKNEKLGSKTHKPHSCFSTIFQHWRGRGKTPTEAQQTRTKKKKLSDTETRSSSKN